MKHKISLSGSYSGHNSDQLFRVLSKEGTLQFTLIGRELQLQVQSGNLDEIKESLKRVGVGNITILEWKKCGVTLNGSGRGDDKEGTIQVSLIPSPLDSGLRSLAFVCDTEVDAEILYRIEKRIGEVLREAGVTDALFTVQVKGEATDEEYLNFAKIATLNALFDAGGVTDVD